MYQPVNAFQIRYTYQLAHEVHPLHLTSAIQPDSTQVPPIAPLPGATFCQPTPSPPWIKFKVGVPLSIIKLMKLPFLRWRHLLALSLTPWLVSVIAQEPEPQGERTVVTERGPHHAVVETVRQLRDEAGQEISVTNSYVELATGLSFIGESGRWEATEEAFELVPGAALAWRGPHKVSLAANANSEGAVALREPGGELLRSHVYGLALHNTATGEAVLAAEVQDSTGVLLASNQVLYPEALVSEGKAVGDLRYTYTKSGLEQDVIVRTKPSITPESQGWDPAVCRYEVWTEFVEAPQPIIQTELINSEEVAQGQTIPILDDTLDFGLMQIGQGRSFLLGQEDENLALITKQWLSTTDERVFLVESVAVPSVAGALEALPEVAPEGASLRSSSKARMQVMTELPRKAKTAANSRGTMRRLEGQDALLAFHSRGGVVLDYVTYNTSQTNLVLKGDTTYLLTGLVTLYGTNTVCEGGAVIKYTNNTANVKLVVNTPLTWGGTMYRPVILTARDDHSVGEKIGSGTLAGYYADVALSLNAATSSISNFQIAHLRVAHAKSAIELQQKTGHVLSHLQLVNCQNGILPTSADFSLRNALFHKVLTNFTGSASVGRIEHLTANTAIRLHSASTFSSLYLTNSLLVAVTNVGTMTVTNKVAVVSSPTGIFQSAQAGAHYLATGTYRNIGTTAINSALKSSFASATTYPPITYTNSIFVNTVLGPTVQRDTDTPDLGYHYPVLDYMFSGLTATNATVFLTNGVAVATYGNTGITLRAGAKFVSQGTPAALNRIVRYEAVQEQPTVLGTNSGSYFFAVPAADGGTFALRFTDAAFQAQFNNRRQLVQLDARDSWNITIRDSSLRGVHLICDDDGGDASIIGLTNNVVDRCSLEFSDDRADFTVNALNNLFLWGTINLRRSSSPAWNFEDNLFDRTTCSVLSGPVSSLRNAYTSSTGVLPSGVGNRTNLLRDFVSGPLGPYYYPTSGATNSLASLINAETNRTPASVGLYHFTTVTTTGSKEAATALDIGFHYVGVNASGAPLDDDGDGLPNYLEDLNGNGTTQSGETKWNVAGDPGLSVWITRPINGQPLP